MGHANPSMRAAKRIADLILVQTGKSVPFSATMYIAGMIGEELSNTSGAVRFSELLELGKAALRQTDIMRLASDSQTVALLCALLTQFDQRFDADLREYFDDHTTFISSGFEVADTINNLSTSAQGAVNRKLARLFEVTNITADEDARAQRVINSLHSLGILRNCEACKGRKDRHVESATYSGQSTCPDCGGTGLHRIKEVREAIASALAQSRQQEVKEIAKALADYFGDEWKGNQNLYDAVIDTVETARQRAIEVVKAKRDEWQEKANKGQLGDYSDERSAFLLKVFAANEIIATLEADNAK